MKCRARTAEDEQRAYRQGEAEGIRRANLFFLHVTLLFLADKHGWEEEELKQYINYMMIYSEQFISGEVNLDDIKQVLKDEYDIEIQMV